MRDLVLLDGDIGVQHVVYDFSRKVGNRENSSTKNKFCLDLYSYFKEISNIEFRNAGMHHTAETCGSPHSHYAFPNALEFQPLPFPRTHRHTELSLKL